MQKRYARAMFFLLFLTITGGCEACLKKNSIYSLIKVQKKAEEKPLVRILGKGNASDETSDDKDEDPGLVTVPNVKGKQSAAAGDQVQAVGLTVGSTIYIESTKAPGTVLDQYPKPNEEVAKVNVKVWKEERKAEQKAREEAKQKAREEAKLKAKEEAEQKAREEAELKAKEEAEKKEKEETERQANEEAELKAKEEAEQKAREEAEQKANEEAEQKAKEEAEQKAREKDEKRRKSFEFSSEELQSINEPETNPASSSNSKRHTNKNSGDIKGAQGFGDLGVGALETGGIKLAEIKQSDLLPGLLNLSSDEIKMADLRNLSSDEIKLPRQPRLSYVAQGFGGLGVGALEAGGIKLAEIKQSDLLPGLLNLSSDEIKMADLPNLSSEEIKMEDLLNLSSKEKTKVQGFLNFLKIGEPKLAGSKDPNSGEYAKVQKLLLNLVKTGNSTSIEKAYEEFLKGNPPHWFWGLLERIVDNIPSLSEEAKKYIKGKLSISYSGNEGVTVVYHNPTTTPVVPSAKNNAGSNNSKVHTDKNNKDSDKSKEPVKNNAGSNEPEEQKLPKDEKEDSDKSKEPETNSAGSNEPEEQKPLKDSDEKGSGASQQSAALNPRRRKSSGASLSERTGASTKGSGQGGVPVISNAGNSKQDGPTDEIEECEVKAPIVQRPEEGLGVTNVLEEVEVKAPIVQRSVENSPLQEDGLGECDIETFVRVLKTLSEKDATNLSEKDATKMVFSVMHAACENRKEKKEVRRSRDERKKLREEKARKIEACLNAIKRLLTPQEIEGIYPKWKSGAMQGKSLKPAVEGLKPSYTSVADTKSVTRIKKALNGAWSDTYKKVDQRIKEHGSKAKVPYTYPCLIALKEQIQTDKQNAKKKASTASSKGLTLKASGKLLAEYRAVLKKLLEEEKNPTPAGFRLTVSNGYYITTDKKQLKRRGSTSSVSKQGKSLFQRRNSLSNVSKGWKNSKPQGSLPSIKEQSIKEQ